jgi:hypothetical protein
LNSNVIELAEPNLVLAGLKLWVHGYQFPSADDYWDGNWLNVTATCSSDGATVQVQGFFIRTDEISEWQRTVDKLGADLIGEAKLACMEPYLSVTLTAGSLSGIEMEVRITPNHLTQEHRFEFSIDQSYLAPLSSQCTRILRAFPLRGA